MKETERPSLSVIIPVYNVERYIEQCLLSIMDSIDVADSATEVIVIDDGSTDSSAIIAEEIAVKYDGIKVIHQKNSGVAQARNRGIEEACGEWLYFVDSDDWVSRDTISILCEKSQENQDADVILFDAYRNSSDKQQGWEHFPEEMQWEDGRSIRQLQAGVLYFPIMDKKTKVPLAAPWDKLFRYKFIMENNLRFQSDLKVLDDMVFNFEVFGCAKKVAYCKEKIYHYRYVPTSITNSYKPQRVKSDMQVWRYIEKYMGQAEGQDKELLKQAFYGRIIKSFCISCKLSLFHDNNKKTRQQKINYALRVLNMEPYQTAFQEVHIRNLEWKLKIITLFGRRNWIKGIYYLHLAENLLNRK